jgi:DNA repair exonuclease SbcCD ATPase subunit
VNPLRVTASNYRTFERLDVTLPTGTVAIVGPNGAGKSSILNAVDVCLFADRGELPGLLTVGEDELELQLEFEHGGELYRVRRQFSARGRGKTVLDLELRQTMGALVGEWTPLTRETAVATQELISKTLGLSRTTFRASSFLRQGDGAAFTEAQPRDRKAILAEILGLDLWDRLLDRARADLRVEEDGLVKLAALIAGCDELVALKPLAVAALESAGKSLAENAAALTTAEGELEAARAEHAAAAVVEEQIRTADAEARAAIDAHARASAELKAATDAAEQLADKMIELEEVAADAARVPEIEARVAQLRVDAVNWQNAVAKRDLLVRDADTRDLARERMLAQMNQIAGDVDVMLGKADHLLAHLADSPECATCGQTMGAEAAQRAAASYRADAETLTVKGDALSEACTNEAETIGILREHAAAVVVPVVEDVAPFELELRALQSATALQATLTEQVKMLAEKSGKREAFEAASVSTASFVVEKTEVLDVLKANVPDATVLEAKVERHRIAVQEGRRLVEARQAEIVRAEAELERIAETEAQLVAHREQVAIGQAGVDVLKLAERAYGRDGIPALILESSAVPWIEAEGNRILSELGTSYRVELRTQAANKTNALLRETLDIVVNDGANIRPYETFSGGEKTRINLALRLALAGLLANRRGAQSRLLAIDELDGLDAAGMDALVGVLNGLAGTFDRIVVVSHQAQLATAFDQLIEVAKADGKSQIVGALEVAVA